MSQATARVEFVSCGTASDPLDQDWALALIRQVGISRASRMVGCSRLALSNVAFGLPCHRGTQLLVRDARLAERSAAGI